MIRKTLVIAATLLCAACGQQPFYSSVPTSQETAQRIVDRGTMARDTRGNCYLVSYTTGYAASFQYIMTTIPCPR